MTRRILILSFYLLFFVCATIAQTAINLPYFCGFEETQENVNWTLNPNSSGSLNQWYVSSATSSLGRNALYISQDGGLSTTYNISQSRLSVAYREISLTTGNYELSFSWKVGGDANTKLYVLWMPANISTQNLPVSTLPIPWQAYKCSFSTVDNLSGSNTWQIATTNISVPNPPLNSGNYKLVFVATNGNTNGHINLSACVDNIQITELNPVCPQPTNFDYTRQSFGDLIKGNTLHLSWTGTAQSYDLQYSSSTNQDLYQITGITGNSITLNNITEGVWSFLIRANCGNTKSKWVQLKNVPVYDPNIHCLDFINFDPAAGVHGTYGTYPNPYANNGFVNTGAEDARRHTIFYEQDEYDSYTNNLLLKVPHDEVVSFRLGNSHVYDEAESVTYDYTVGQDVDILLLKYAVVLQNPGHATYSQPKFKFELLDEYDNILGGSICGSANFVPGTNTENWNVVNAGTDNEVNWKDWTTVGVNIAQYQGQTIRVRLTTYDCNEGLHFGYAYFSLSCASATISTTSCGASSTISVSAPDGFDYEWRKAGNQNILGTDKDFNINASDSGTYVVTVKYKEAPECSFQLTAQLFPRFPVANASYLYAPTNCRNTVRMINTSGIIKTENDTTTYTGEKPNTYYWNFGDGRTSNEEAPTIEFPDSGGTYTVKLKVGISEDACMDSTEIVITIPPIGEKTDTIFGQICQGRRFYFENVAYSSAGNYPLQRQTVAGCDSLVILSLTVVDKIEISLRDTICYGQTYTFNNQTYRRTGTYMATVPSVAGCDSVTTLHLVVKDRVNFTATSQDAQNGINSGSIHIDPLPDNYSYTINGITNGDLENLSAGTYVIKVYDDSGCASDSVIFEIKSSCLDMEFLPLSTICKGESELNLDYVLNDGYLSTYSVKFSEKAIVAGFENIINQPISTSNTSGSIIIPIPDDIRPDIYTAVVSVVDKNCVDNDFEKEIQLTILYPSTLVEQKWNDVLAIPNERYNGGYIFTSFQWYRNGEVIYNERGSYLYLGEGTIFNPNDAYHVELTRLGENYSVATCPMYPVLIPESDLSVYPTFVNEGGVVIVKAKASTKINIRMMDTMGLVYNTVVADDEIQLTMPNRKGVYLLETHTESGVNKTFHILVR